MEDVTFSLFAPYNKQARLAGDFSNWEQIEMIKGNNGWFTCDYQLPSGNYEYKFLVESLSPFACGDLLWISDPRAFDLNRINENSIARVRQGNLVAGDHDWKHDREELPANEKLVIYELHVNDFTGGDGDNGKGMFRDILHKLDYLCDLGINALELMPITEFPRDISWGYNHRYLFAPESAYGSPEELMILIDECHHRGIRVILDMVLNHADRECPLTQIDYCYWFNDYRAGNWNEWGFPDFNYTHYDSNMGIYPAREFARDVCLHWIDNYHIDGLRLDATRAIDNYDFLRWLASETKKHAGDKPFIVIAEHLPPDPTLSNGYDIDSQWHNNFHNQMKANLREGLFHGCFPYDITNTMRAIAGTWEGFDEAISMINYIESHDEERLMHELATNHIYNDKAFQKAKLATSILLTSVGIPMLYHGEEFAEYTRKYIEVNKIHWNLLNNNQNKDLHKHFKKLIDLRKNNNALSTPNIEFIHKDHFNHTLAYKRWDEHGNVILVAANFSNKTIERYRFPHWPYDGTWTEQIYNYDIQSTGGYFEDEMPASTAKIYLLQN